MLHFGLTSLGKYRALNSPDVKVTTPQAIGGKLYAFNPDLSLASILRRLSCGTQVISIVEDGFSRLT